MPAIYVKFAFRTDIGQKSELNEDNCFSASSGMNARNGIIAVLAAADGMGGYDAGDVASKITCEYLEHLFVRGGYVGFAQSLGIDPFNYGVLLTEVIHRINKKIFDRAQSFKILRTMGCTCVVGLVVYDSFTNTTSLIVGWIGDSRCYIVGREGILLATEDDSYVWDLYKMGNISYPEIRLHPKRNVLTQALGTKEAVDPHINRVALNSDDIILLCTDGLHGSITEQTMKAILTSSPDAETATRRLVDAANEADGNDNISVAVAYCFQEPKRAPVRFARAKKVALVAGLVALLAVGSFIAIEPAVDVHATKPVQYILEAQDISDPATPGDVVLVQFTVDPYEEILQKRSYYKLAVAVDHKSYDTLSFSTIAQNTARIFSVPLRFETPETHRVQLTLLSDIGGSPLSSDEILVDIRKPMPPPRARRADSPVHRGALAHQLPIFRFSSGVDGKLQIWVSKDIEIEGEIDVELTLGDQQGVVTLTKKNRSIPKTTMIDYKGGEQVILGIRGTSQQWTHTLR